MNKWLFKLKKIASHFRSERSSCLVMFMVMKDRRTNKLVRLLLLFFLCYLLSPFDLIPDFIPVLGWLDDAIVILFGMVLVNYLVPPQVLEDSRSKAKQAGTSLPTKLLWAGLAIMIAFWAALLFFALQIYLLVK